jgi:phosphatidylserine decarboxylase
MVRDGYWYAISLLLVAAVVRFFTADWFAIPEGPGLVVSPADGKITEIAPIHTTDGDRIRLSIFLNVFDVHVNRSPIAGIIRRVQYKKGEYLNALDPASAERNEQSVVTMEGDGCMITFKLIAGLLARRIVFLPKEGDTLRRGQRVGLIKFGSRCDLVLPGNAHIRVERGQRVKGGQSILADVEVLSYEPTPSKDVMETRR